MTGSQLPLSVSKTPLDRQAVAFACQQHASWQASACQQDVSGQAGSCLCLSAKRLITGRQLPLPVSKTYQDRQGDVFACKHDVSWLPLPLSKTPHDSQTVAFASQQTHQDRQAVVSVCQQDALGQAGSCLWLSSWRLMTGRQLHLLVFQRHHACQSRKSAISLKNPLVFNFCLPPLYRLSVDSAFKPVKWSVWHLSLPVFWSLAGILLLLTLPTGLSPGRQAGWVAWPGASTMPPPPLSTFHHIPFLFSNIYYCFKPHTLPLFLTIWKKVFQFNYSTFFKTLHPSLSLLPSFFLSYYISASLSLAPVDLPYSTFTLSFFLILHTVCFLYLRLIPFFLLVSLSLSLFISPFFYLSHSLSPFSYFKSPFPFSFWKPFLSPTWCEERGLKVLGKKWK